MLFFFNSFRRFLEVKYSLTTYTECLLTYRNQCYCHSTGMLMIDSREYLSTGIMWKEDNVLVLYTRDCKNHGF